METIVSRGTHKVSKESLKILHFNGLREIVKIERNLEQDRHKLASYEDFSLEGVHRFFT